MRSLAQSTLSAWLLAIAMPCVADEIGTTKKKDDRAAEVSANDSADAALKKFTVAPGLQIDVWAAEPLLANPVALTFDEKGRAFVAETHRRRTSVPDIRKHEPWRIENLGIRSVEERVAFFKAKYPETGKIGAGIDVADLNGDGRRDWRDLGVESERIKLVVDSDGDGKANTSSVFAEGFNSPATGIGAGVVAANGSVWYTCIPDLWRLDGEKDGAAEKKEALLTGFGVHVVFSGHDMHGPKFGPDGRLYFSIADCGASVKTKEGTVIENPDSGAIFRCNPDGTKLELFAKGLRNPQSLAFNDVGDLFTGDNNADGGDKARWLHIVEGADYGWRLGWQFLSKLGAWNSEGMWHMDSDKTNLSILPPAGHIGHGPAGIAYYPGTGLPEKYRGHFFMADFPGGVRSFALEPRGASYTIAGLNATAAQDNSQKDMTGKLVWGLYPSDVAFGSDGGLYVLDWIQGWEKTGKGRIFRVHDPAVSASALVKETKRLLADGMSGREEDELARLLGHADQRVRMHAELTLVQRRLGRALLDVAMKGTTRLARLHAIWGYSQSLRQTQQDDTFAERKRDEQGMRELEALMKSDPAAAERIIKEIQLKLPAPNLVETETEDRMKKLSALFSDGDEEVVAQAAKGIAELHSGFRNMWCPPEVSAALLKAALHPSPRVRFFVAQTLGKLRIEKADEVLVTVLKENGNKDAFVRHAAVVALSQCPSLSSDQLYRYTYDADEGVRTGAFFATIRRPFFSGGRFLSDAKEPQLQLEAARAVHDCPTPNRDALKYLRDLLRTKFYSFFDEVRNKDDRVILATYRRVVNAAYRIGDAESAKLLADAASGRIGNEETAEFLVGAAVGPAFGYAIRMDALEALAQWPLNLGRDRVLGLVIPGNGERKASDAADALAPFVPLLLKEPSVRDEQSEALQIAALEAIGANRLIAASDEVAALVANQQTDGKIRAAALRSLVAMGSPKLVDAVRASLADTDKVLLEAARKLAAKASPAEAVKANAVLLGKETVREQQEALATISEQPGAEADAVILAQMDLLIAGKLPAPLWLDVIEATMHRNNDTSKAKLAEFESRRDAKDALAKWRECMEGGDAKAGREVFAEMAAAACMRCHKVKGEGGDVGPDLAGIAKKHDRAYLLQAIVDPNAVIAPGFDNVLLTLKNGDMVAGLLSAENATEVTITAIADGKKQKVQAADIKERTKVPSGMPPGLGEVLGKHALRDLIEYLATLK